MSKVTAPVFPSFNTRATSIRQALIDLDMAGATSADLIKTAMQGYIDEVFLVTGKRDQPTCEMLGKMIRESEVIEQMIMDMLIEKPTVTNYAQGAMRALHFKVDWTPRLFQQTEEYKLPWSKKQASEKATGTKGSSTDPKKAGKVSTTTDKELLETYRKAIQQARLLNRATQVGALIDLALEVDAEFKE
jgi:hypothetical protein